MSETTAIFGQGIFMEDRKFTLKLCSVKIDLSVYFAMRQNLALTCVLCGLHFIWDAAFDDESTKISLFILTAAVSKWKIIYQESC